VSDIAGTTRDTIEEILNINGIIFRLIDTAGIREHSGDIIESMGMQRSMDMMKSADVVVYLYDVNTTTDHDIQEQIALFEQQQLKYILVANKTDTYTGGKDGSIIYISAKNKDNVPALKQALYNKVIAGEINTEGTIITNARHYASLQEVLQSLTDIKAGLDNNIASDLIALDIRRCLFYLGEITGEVTTEDKLDYIFSKFCIGK
jgi:tRNA modification GTPase